MVRASGQILRLGQIRQPLDVDDLALLTGGGEHHSSRLTPHRGDVDPSRCGSLERIVKLEDELIVRYGAFRDGVRQHEIADPRRLEIGGFTSTMLASRRRPDAL